MRNWRKYHIGSPVCGLALGLIDRPSLSPGYSLGADMSPFRWYFQPRHVSPENNLVRSKNRKIKILYRKETTTIWGWIIPPLSNSNKGCWAVANQTPPSLSRILVC